MCDSRQPMQGADSAQALANAIALAENAADLSLKEAGFRDVTVEVRLAPRVGWHDLREHVNDHPKFLFLRFIEKPVVPACIACELPALPGDIYCKGHARLMDYTSGEKWAANE